MKYPIIKLPVSMLRGAPVSGDRERAEELARHGFRAGALPVNFDPNKVGEQAARANIDAQIKDWRMEDTVELIELFEVDPEVPVQQAIAVAESNLARLPRTTDASIDSALQSSSAIDEFLSERHFSNLESILPDFKDTVLGSARDALASVKEVADSFIQGELPPDLKDFIERTSAEQNISQGRFGQVASFGTARDLGLTSLDLINRGVQLQTEAVSPLSQRLLSTAMSLMPPTTDPQAIFGQAMGVASGASMLTPGSVLQSGTQVALANSQLAWTAHLSSENMAMDMWQTRIQQDMNRDMLQSATNNAWIGAGAAIIGAGIGGAAKMASGGQA